MHFSVLVNTKTDPFLNPDELHRKLDRYQMFDCVVLEGMELSWQIESSESDLLEMFNTKKLYNVVTGDQVMRYGSGWPKWFKINHEIEATIPSTHSIRTHAGVEYAISNTIIQDYDNGVIKYQSPSEIYPDILSWWKAEESPDYLIIDRSEYVNKSATDFARECNLGLYGEILVYNGENPNDVFTVNIVNEHGIYDYYTIGGRWKNRLINTAGWFVNTIMVNEWDTKTHAIFNLGNVITDNITSLLGRYSYDELYKYLKRFKKGRYLSVLDDTANAPFDSTAAVKRFYKMVIDDAPETWTTWGIITDKGYFEKDWSADAEIDNGLLTFEIEFERRIKECDPDSFLTIVDMHV